jgi:hypothetical protein
MVVKRRRQPRQRRRRMAHRQNQQIALQPTTGIGDDTAFVNAQRLFAQVNQSPAARPYRLGKTLADIAPKLAALGYSEPSSRRACGSSAKAG